MKLKCKLLGIAIKYAIKSSNGEVSQFRYAEDYKAWPKHLLVPKDQIKKLIKRWYKIRNTLKLNRVINYSNSNPSSRVGGGGRKQSIGKDEYLAVYKKLQAQIIETKRGASTRDILNIFREVCMD